MSFMLYRRGGCRGGGEGVKIKRSAIEFLIFHEEGRA